MDEQQLVLQSNCSVFQFNAVNLSCLEMRVFKLLKPQYDLGCIMC